MNTSSVPADGGVASAKPSDDVAIHDIEQFASGIRHVRIDAVFQLLLDFLEGFLDLRVRSAALYSLNDLALEFEAATRWRRAPCH